MKELSYKEWINKAIELFGKDSKNWGFVCPSCGHIQSVKSVLEHNPSLNPEDVKKWINYSCEGRYNEGEGCDWTLGGLFKIHKLEINYLGKEIPSFEFAKEGLSEREEQSLIESLEPHHWIGKIINENQKKKVNE